MVEYGTQLRVAAGSFINCNCCFIDCAAITIGARVLIGPNVSFYTATHPVDPRVRNGMQGPEYALPIIVEDDVWVGGSVVICPGVVLGKGCVVGAGSVVTKVCIYALASPVSFSLCLSLSLSLSLAAAQGYW